MEIGMLWFDDGPTSLKEKVSQAVAFYEQKFGEKPTHCLVHPKTLNGGEGDVAGVSVRKARNVMPNHYWIGVEEASAEAKVSNNRKRSRKAEAVVQGKAA
jgi:hypothetical protein